MLIDKYNRQQTLKNSNSFKKYKNIISDDFNLLLYINIGENTFRSFEKDLNNDLKIKNKVESCGVSGNLITFKNVKSIPKQKYIKRTNYI